VTTLLTERTFENRKSNQKFRQINRETYKKAFWTAKNIKKIFVAQNLPSFGFLCHIRLD
jgi:hypothetical protein